MRGFLSDGRSMERVICCRRSLQNWCAHLFLWSVRREQWAGIDKKGLVKDVFFLLPVLLTPLGGEHCFWLLA